MANRNSAVAALAGIIVGTLMGAGTVHYAQVVAFSGADPNFAKTQPAPKYSEMFRYRSTSDDPYARVSNTVLRSSAPTVVREYDYRGVPENCIGLSGTRLTHCIDAFRDGILYQPYEIPRY